MSVTPKPRVKIRILKNILLGMVLGSFAITISSGIVNGIAFAGAGAAFALWLITMFQHVKQGGSK